MKRRSFVNPFHATDRVVHKKDGSVGVVVLAMAEATTVKVKWQTGQFADMLPQIVGVEHLTLYADEDLTPT